MTTNPFSDAEPICERLNEAKVASKYKSLLFDASKLIQSMNAAHHNTVHELEHAVRQCEEMKNALRDTTVSKETYDSLQKRVNELREAIDMQEDRSWKSFPVVFTATVTFIIGFVLAATVLPLLRST